MNKFVCRLLLPAFIAAVMPLLLSAQPAAPDSPDDARAAVCGTQLVASMDMNSVLANTARINPALYQRMMARDKRSGGPALLSVTDETTHDFYVLNRVTNSFDNVTAKLIFVGRRARIWIDERDTLRVKKGTINALARGLDTASTATSRNPNKGIIDNDEEVFGQPPTNQFDPSTPNVEDFLLTDIQDNIAGGNILGFFSPWDQTSQGGSNMMNILYIDSREGIGSQSASAIAGLIGTLAHEYQHLIHYRQNPNSQTFYNEGCSETASIICGYRSRTNSAYMQGINVSLMRWSDGSVYNDLEIDYERAMSFIHYCSEQYGEAFLTKFVPTKSTNMNRISSTLQQIGSSATWQSTLKGFAVANYVRLGYSDDHYIYQTPLSTTLPKPNITFKDTLPAAGQATVQPYAAIYNQYSFTAANGMTIRFDASGTYAVYAMLYRNNQLIDVRELTNNAVNTIENTPGFTRIVFSVINLGNSSQTVKWTVAPIPSGVENSTIVMSGTAISDVAPNPTQGSARVSYGTAAGAPVTMQLFDMQGRMMRTLVDGEVMEPGMHAIDVDPTGLPDGVYLIRIAQGTTIATRALIVQR